jgi:Uma2 family endonuclease
MSTAAPEKLMSVEEFLALPEDEGKDRMLIRGQLWEKPMTRRNRWHSKTEARIAGLLDRWLQSQPAPRGEIYSGEAGVLLRRDPDTVVGIDVCYVAPEVADKDSEDTRLIDGAPILAVEILSPSDKQEEITAKVDEYLAAGVKLVWVVDPHFKTVVVHEPAKQPKMFAGEDELLGDPHLPGFRTSVSAIFRR